MWKKCFPLCLFLICAVSTGSIVFASTTLTYEYDRNGNMIRGDGKTFEYNDANQLVRVRHGDESGPVIAEYVYDYTGQRIKKIENGVTTYYIGKHYETQVTPTGVSNTSYYFANGERVAKKDNSGNLFFYHSDHLGGTDAVTDSDGHFVEKISYYPFGEIRAGGKDRYTYTGKEKDQVSDFYYFEARHYKYGFNHFTQADTVEPNLYDPQDLNRYAYVRNNPLKYVDPTGHKFAGAFEKLKNRINKQDSKYAKNLYKKLAKEDKSIIIQWREIKNGDIGLASFPDENYVLITFDSSLLKNNEELAATFAHEATHVYDFFHGEFKSGTNLSLWQRGILETRARDAEALVRFEQGKWFSSSFIPLLGFPQAIRDENREGDIPNPEEYSDKFFNFFGWEN